MVSEVLDVSRWLFTNQDYSQSGFKGPYICWAVFKGYGLTIITRIIVWILHEHSETWTFHQLCNWTLVKFWLYLNFCPLFPQWGEEIYEQEVNLDNLLSFSCSRYPSQGTQVMLTQDKETKKVWTLQPKPSQRSSLRSTGKVQECSLMQWLHNPTSCTCAALQQAAAAVGRLRSISLVCRLHNTITLHLTAVRFTQGHLSGWDPPQGQLSIHAQTPEVSRGSKVS